MSRNIKRINKSGSIYNDRNVANDNASSCLSPCTNLHYWEFDAWVEIRRHIAWVISIDPLFYSLSLLVDYANFNLKT